MEKIMLRILNINFLLNLALMIIALKLGKISKVRRKIDKILLR